MANSFSTASQPAKGGLFSSMANPVIRKMEKKGEYGSDRAATYGGIVGKTVWFLLVTVAGVFASIILNDYYARNDPTQLVHWVDDRYNIFDLTIHPVEIGVLAAVLLISIVVPFLSWFVRRTIPVVGTIYSAAQGILIGYITVALVQEYKFISVLAMLITLAIVAAMLFVYAKKIIKVTARFRGIITAIFLSVIVSGLVFFVLTLIPAVRNTSLFAGIQSALDNPVFSITLSIIFVIIAALFLLVDFDTVQRCVENKIDKKYEWMAAWGLAYTIIYIYFKILRILIILFGKGKNSK